MVQADEAPLLVEGRCTFLDGIVGKVGQARLTRDRLTFEPRSIDRWVGLEGITVLRSEIVDSRVEGVDSLLVLTLKSGRRLRFGGGVARKMAPHLRALLDPKEEPAMVPVHAEQDGVLLSETVEVRINLLLSAKAHLYITHDTVHLRQADGIEARLLHVEPFSIPLGAIEVLEVDGLFRSLTMGRDERVVVLSGHAIPRIYATLHCARLSGASDLRLHAAAAPMSLANGPLAVDGYVAFGPRHFVFVPGGVLDAVVGNPVVEVAWEKVRGASLEGDRILSIESDGDPHRFVLTRVEESWQALKRTLLHRHEREIVPGMGTRTVSLSILRDFLADWELALEPGEHPVWMRYVLRLRSAHHVEGSWLLMTDRAFYLLPEPGLGQKGRRVPLADAASLRTWAKGEATIRLMLAQDPWEVEVWGGAAGVEDFWSRCPLHSYQPPKDRPTSTFPLPRLEGPAHFIRLHLRDRELLRIYRPQLENRPDGLHIRYDKAVAFGPGVPNEGFLDIADGRGVYRQRALLIEEEGDTDPAVGAFSLALVSKAERVSRREEYRVMVNLPVLISIPNGDDVHGELLDLSGGGCAMLTDGVLPVDRPLRFDFELLGVRFHLHGNVLRTRKMADPSTQWRHGVQFSSERSDIIVHLRHLLIQVQRERAVAERQAEQDTEDLHNGTLG